MKWFYNVKSAKQMPQWNGWRMENQLLHQRTLLLRLMVKREYLSSRKLWRKTLENMFVIVVLIKPLLTSILKVWLFYWVAMSKRTFGCSLATKVINHFFPTCLPRQGYWNYTSAIQCGGDWDRDCPFWYWNLWGRCPWQLETKRRTPDWITCKQIF